MAPGVDETLNVNSIKCAESVDPVWLIAGVGSSWTVVKIKKDS